MPYRDQRLARLVVDEEELVKAWNEHCEFQDKASQKIYPNEDEVGFNVLMRDLPAYEVAYHVFKGSWNPFDKWVRLDVFLTSSNCPDDYMDDEFIDDFVATYEED